MIEIKKNEGKKKKEMYKTIKIISMFRNPIQYVEVVVDRRKLEHWGKGVIISSFSLPNQIGFGLI